MVREHRGEQARQRKLRKYPFGGKYLKETIPKECIHCISVIIAKKTRGATIFFECYFGNTFSLGEYNKKNQNILKSRSEIINEYLSNKKAQKQNGRVCVIFHEVIYSETLLKNHYAHIHPSFCSICMISFLSVNRLRKHMREIHDTSEEASKKHVTIR